MPPSTRRNPLALAILTVLSEGPRHPYEIAATLKKRSKHESIRLNYGALYSVVDRLAASGFIEVLDVEREGRRPERTTYGLTDAGLTEMTEWLSDLLAEPSKEYRDVEAALSLMLALPVEDVLGLLQQRLHHLDLELARQEAMFAHARAIGLPRVFTVEGELAGALVRAERDFVAALVDEMAAGTLEGIGLWRTFHGPSPYDGDAAFDPEWPALDQPATPTLPRPAWEHRRGRDTP